jgi:tetratricopeptide (TPR) repeat protein
VKVRGARRWVPILAALFVISVTACRQDPKREIEQARQYERVGNSGLAMESYRKVLDRHPKNVDALVGLAELYLDDDQPERASPLIDRALDLAPDDAAPHRAMGRYLLSQRLWLQAEEHLELASRKDLFDPKAYFYLGMALEKLGEKDKAILVFQKVLTLKPDYPHVHESLGDAYCLKESYERAMQEYEQAVDETPKNADLLERLALTYYYLHFNDSAERTAKRTLELNPKAGGAENILGSVAFANKDLDGAQEHFLKAIALDPNAVAPHANLGAIYKAKGAPDKALAEFQLALKLEPNNAETQKNLGDLYLSQSKIPEALTQYRAYLRAKPNDAYIAYVTAKLISRTPNNDPDEGLYFLDSFNRTSGLDIIVNEIRFAMTTGRDKPTGEKLDGLRRSYPYLPDVFAVRALLYERKKDLEDAKETIEMALLMTLDDDQRLAFQKRLESYKKGTIPPPPPNYS